MTGCDSWASPVFVCIFASSAPVKTNEREAKTRMNLSFHCPQCGTTHTVPDTYAGQIARCNKCGNRQRIPSIGGFDAPCASSAEPTIAAIVNLEPGASIQSRMPADLPEELATDPWDSDALTTCPLQLCNGR